MGAYFDFSPAMTSSNIPPVGDARRSDQISDGRRMGKKFIYLTNKESTRNMLKETFLPKYLSDTEINNLS